MVNQKINISFEFVLCLGVFALISSFDLYINYHNQMQGVMKTISYWSVIVTAISILVLSLLYSF